MIILFSKPVSSRCYQCKPFNGIGTVPLTVLFVLYDLLFLLLEKNKQGRKLSVQPREVKHSHKPTDQIITIMLHQHGRRLNLHPTKANSRPCFRQLEEYRRDFSDSCVSDLDARLHKIIVVLFVESTTMEKLFAALPLDLICTGGKVVSGFGVPRRLGFELLHVKLDVVVLPPKPLVILFKIEIKVRKHFKN